MSLKGENQINKVNFTSVPQTRNAQEPVLTARSGTMPAAFPYAYVACPCSDQVDNPATNVHARRVSSLRIRHPDDDEDGDDEPIDPHDARSDFKLHPYDQLLFCDECQQIRCPRCWTEETTHWYCPSCLFEVPGSVVKTDGNRCTRNCYNCPLCTSPLLVNSLDQHSGDASATAGPFFLACPHCEWSSLDVGIELSKPNKITEQLLRLRDPKRHAVGTPLPDEPMDDSPSKPIHDEPVEDAFTRLLNFYDTQLSESDAVPSNLFGLDASYSSPSNLARIMQLYGGLSAPALKKAREKPRPMREALSTSEGLSVLSDNEIATISRLRTTDPSELTTFAQRSSHPWNSNARFVSDLWPVPSLLMTKKSKRCRTCRLILIRHDDRKTTGSSAGTGSSSAATSMRYKIRLLAQNNIPRLSLRPFSPSRDFPRPSFALTTSALTSLSTTTASTFTLHPSETKQFLLHVSNPLFETAHITLATPATTPGPIPARITILCPSFALGPDGDMWDSALDTSASSSTTTTTGPERSRAGPKNLAGGPGQSPDDPAEAGKVWARGRNWASVVVEVGAPASLSRTTSGREAEGDADEDFDDAMARKRRERKGRSALRAGRVEIPVFVRAEWEADVVGGGAGGEDKAGGREKRLVEFWCVLGGIAIEDR